MWPYWGRCGLVGGNISLGVGLEVSKAHARPKFSLLLSLLPMDQSVKFSAPGPGLWATTLHVTMIMDEPSETLKCLLL